MLAVSFEVGCDGGMQASGEDFGKRRMIAVRRDQGKFVAAKPRQIGLAGERAQLLRQFAKHVVADRVAEHVVDLLEAVEVDAQHGEGFVVCPCGIDGASEMLDEGGPIGQVRQGIVVRHMLDAGLRLLALGNVLRKADEVALFAALVRYREILGGQDAGAVVRGVNDVLIDGLQLARAQGLAGEREQIVRGFLAG